MLFSAKQFIVWSCILFSIILETIGRRKIHLKFLASALVPFLYRSLSFATLQSFRKWETLMHKFQIWVKNMVNISTPSFKDLPDKLSIPAALLMLQLFRRFKIYLAWLVWKVNTRFYTKLFSCHWKLLY